MGNDELGKNEVTKLLEKGWRLRTKKVKDQRYISIRKGNREKGLGSYNQEKYNQLLSLQNNLPSSKPVTDIQETSRKSNVVPLSESIERQKRLTEELVKQLEKMQLYRGLIKSSECAHITDRYCTYWNWEKKEQIPKSHRFTNPLWEPEFKEIIISETNERRWVARAAGSFCKYCSMFRQRE